jgi:predicted CxxxxCH...CXXCH cytochrome family protein
MDHPLPAYIIWGDVADASGAMPKWDHASATCTNVYCHGATLTGGTNTSPTWTTVDGTQSACGTCHGLPPPAPHPDNQACENCHMPVAGPNLTLADPLRHDDGILDVIPTNDCSNCHGSAANSAPPADTMKRSDTSLVSVGAHQTHLLGGVSSKAVACEQCHTVPKQLNDPGHIDHPLPAYVIWGDVAKSGGASPMWNHGAATCANTYCHMGGTQTATAGGSLNTPSWTKVDGSQAACGTCHGLPPPAPHPANDRCELCHSPTAGPNQTIAERSTHVDGKLQVSIGNCQASCHGGTENLAPPLDTMGHDDPTTKAVGAHQTHMSGGMGSAPVACDSCHVVPASVDEPGHRDHPLPAYVRFHGVSLTSNASPVWDENAATCANTYCHGKGLTGGSNTTPTWTKVDGTQAACGTCHGMPPAAPHVQNARCELCHAPTAGPNKTIANPATHVDGILQVQSGSDCTQCHGTMGISTAPPKDTHGATSTSSITVGAHAAHLQATLGLSRPVDCGECHVVPATVDSPGHIDHPPPAYVVWGPLAARNGLLPVWDRTSGTCANVYCHGATLAGGTITAPKWNKVDGSQAACGDCHGIPPPAPHPSDTNCDICHLPTAGPNQTIAQPSTHIDGIVQVASGCSDCHGSSATNSAPPRDVDGKTVTTLVTVGAHQTHLAGGISSKAVACQECHVVPAAVDSPGHIDHPRPAYVVFGPTATSSSAQPAWSHTQAQCTNTYCHALKGGGGSNTTPLWDKVDGTQAACGNCHGLPPPAPHPQSNRCELCHAPTAGPNQTIVNPATHVDGMLQVQSGDCTQCHGTMGQTSAPPKDSAGGTATTLISVGAHASHLQAALGLSRPVDCAECHVVPATVDSPGHIDHPPPAYVIWGPLAAGAGVAPAWDHATGKCSNVYCHGATLAGGTNTTPTWNKVDGTQAACGDCHGVPPPAPHPAETRCEICHLPTAGPNLTIAQPSTHIDGIVEVASGCGDCHGSPSTNAAPPRDVSGQTMTTLLTVGAHQTHLAGGMSSKAVACGECHTVPAAVNSPGHMDHPPPAYVVFGPTSTSSSSAPTWSHAAAQCANTYCHALKGGGGSTQTPLWNKVDGTQAVCGGCHGLPPPAPHVQNTRCELCHAPTAGPNMTIVNAATHVDGTLQVQTGDCTQCHGMMGQSPAPPKDTMGGTASTMTTVGAHTSHLLGSHNISRPIDCQECHVVPANVDSPGHIDHPPPAYVIWGPLSANGGAAPAWNRTTGKCSNVYCHGGTLTGGSNTSPSWTTVNNTQAACGTCHGLPPPAPHPADSTCENCHAPVAGPNLTLATPARHADGILDVVDTSSCNTCHGSTTNSAPPHDTTNMSATTLVTVGAHQSHLLGGAISAPIACNECHTVPATLNSPGHIDHPPPAYVIWGPLATVNSLAASWDHNTATCTNVYCHGSTLGGGTATAPLWTKVDGTQSMCGSCHGLPPPAPHPPDTNCDTCHLPTAGPNLTIANVATHVDGVVQVASGCSDCHGSSSSNTAPPKDTSGNTASNLVSVGAHQTHLGGGVSSKAVACAECHKVPATVNSPGHIDHPLPAYVIFGPTATSSRAMPTWSHTAAQCANTYCHGRPGAANPTPLWNKVDGTQAACGNCHGLPPPAPHPQSNRCELCHAPTAGPNITIASAATHVDGILQVQTGDCSQCHGTVNVSPAPPHDTTGGVATTLVTVGAHQSHLMGGPLSAPIACNECHVVPATVDSPGHIDHPPPAYVIWGPEATQGSLTASWNRGTATCTNVYCHGSTLQGGTMTSPLWTQVDGTQAACGTCHGVPPPAPHPPNTNCESCHLPTAGPNLTIANVATHVDGIVQVATGCGDCHGSSASDSAPPKDTMGNSATSLVSVGAHQTHLAGGVSSKAVACGECHTVPATVNSPGHIDHPLPAYVNFGSTATSSRAVPAWSHTTAQCSNTYCHGRPGATTPTPTWNKVDGTQARCGACHGLPPPAPHPQSNRCELCHAPTAGPNVTIANPTTHVDGVLQVQTGDCSQCHGTLNVNPAPPHDSTGGVATTLITVGAHQSHLQAVRGLSRPVDCSECHVVPATVDAPGHIDHPPPAYVIWGSLASTTTVGKTLTPTWDGTTGTCKNVYCHGATLHGGSLVSPTWTLVDGTQSACGTCHGTPPPAPHPPQTRCELCHQPTAGPNMTIASAATHIDGIVQVASGCTDCHGSATTNQAPPKDTSGGTATTLITVGAHQAHLLGGVSSKMVACDECHTVPANVNSPGHIDHPPPAYVIFGPTATTNSFVPAWNASTGQCSNTYCHTGTGGSNTAPTWTRVDGTQAACGGCHGIPPPTPAHNGVTDCTGCHLPTAGLNRTIANPATHVDGVLQVNAGSCNGTCHGDSTTPAPPIGVSGGVAASVGAHRVHLAGGSVSNPVACSSCHTVPVNVTDPGHNDHPLPAWVIFSGMSTSNMTAPTYSATTKQCTNTYCHGGASAGGGTNINPIWNAPGSAPCGSCHGLPPPAPHPQYTKCEVCHADAGPNHTIADKTKHLNGVVDVNDLVPCQTCHGSTTNAAPPLDLSGSSSGPTVGAHQVHMAGTTRSLAVPCSECHIPVNPATPNQAGHYDHPLPATMTFGVLASNTSRGAQTPSYGVMGTCTNYCHGATLPGGTMTNISWATTGTLPCNACHGMPPPDSTHGNGTATNCVGCHTDDAGPNQTITVPAKHVDGIVQVSASCNVCHGSVANSAPPNDTHGAATGAKVGVHQQHLVPTIAANPVPCTDCHVSVTTYNSPGHVDHPYPANVIFGGIASNGGVTPSYTPATETCNNTYCHGATLPGGKTAVVFSDTSGAVAQCTGCHGMPPPDATHTGLSATSCNTCHAPVAGPNGTIATPAQHVDGTLQVNGGSCTSCHPSPPTPTTQNYANGGGAHLAHTQFNCDACHSSNGAPGHNQGGTTVLAANVELTFTTPVTFPGGTTTTNGGTPSYNRATQTCNVGCHNPIVNNPKDTPALTNAVTWTAASAPCTSCHANVATASPRNHTSASDTDCLVCHSKTGHTSGTPQFNAPNTASTFTYAPGAIDGLCKNCHSGWTGTAFPNVAAPNESTFWTTSIHGAKGYTCMTCHTYHSAKTTGPLLIDKGSTSCQAAGCHSDLTPTFQLTGGGLLSHHPIEGGTGIAVSCNNCHNPHIAQADPLSAIDPASPTVVYNIPLIVTSTSNHSWNPFCLRCHGPTPPAGVLGAPDISTEQAGGTIVSQFKMTTTTGGTVSLHRQTHRGFGCWDCHDKHGSTGSTGINRGTSLRSFIKINNFPYTGFSSCSTPLPGTVTFSCHN